LIILGFSEDRNVEIFTDDGLDFEIRKKQIINASSSRYRSSRFSRSKRSLQKRPKKEVIISAFGRNHLLQLSPSNFISENYQFNILHGNTIKPDTANYTGSSDKNCQYTGSVFGTAEDYSSAYLNLCTMVRYSTFILTFYETETTEIAQTLWASDHPRPHLIRKIS
jgi:hypothetical protein